MSVILTNSRIVGSTSGDLSGSVFEPQVVGILGMQISRSLPLHGDTLVFNTSSNMFHLTESQGGGMEQVYTDGNITGSGTLLNPVTLKSDITLSSVTASFSGTFVGDGSALTNLPQQDLSAYLTTASAASTYETIANVASGLALKANASELSAYATTGSNTFIGNQIISGSTPLKVFGNVALTSSTLSTYPLHVKASGTAGIAFGGIGTNGTRLEAMLSSDSFGANLVINGQGGGDVYLQNGTTQLIIGSTSNLNSNSKIIVHASNTTNNAIDAVTGSIQVRSGSINVTGSINATGTISGSHAGTANLTSLTASNALISNNLSVAGNLTVNGTMTSVNSTNLEITDKYILIASGAADAAALHGAGLQFGTVPSEDARIIYDAVNDEIEIYPAARSAEFRGNFVGDGSGITGLTTSQISDISLYATTASLNSYVTTSSFNSYTSSVPYDLSGEVGGAPLVSTEIFHFKAVRPFNLAASGHQGGQVVNPTSNVVCNVHKNTTLIGTITFGSTGTFSSSITATSFAVGDMLKVTTPAAVNSISSPYFTFRGTLT